MNTVRIGLIEIGSRSVRYLVIDVWRRVQDFEAIKIETAEHHIDPSRITRADVDKLKLLVSRLRTDLCSHSCDMYCVYGTELCRAIEAMYPGELSSSVRTLSTEEEAMAAWAAGLLCQDAENEKDVITLIDLGNGSTEIVRARWDGARIADLKSTSVALGSSALMASYNNRKTSYMRYLEQQLPPIKEAIEEAGIERTYNGVVYFIGSVATKIGWLIKRRNESEAYRPDLVNGAKIELEKFDELFATIDLRYRRNPKAVVRIIDARRGSEREAVRVISGIPYIAALAKSVHAGNTFLVSGYGVRHGMAYLLKHGLVEA